MSERIFFLKQVVMCSCRDSANTPLAFLFVFFFSLLSTALCRCLMKGSWQSIISSDASRRMWRQGRTRCWWMLLKYFQLLTWKTGPHRVPSGEMPHKNMSIWPINNTANVYLCVVGLSLGRCVCRWTHLFECRRHLFHWDLGSTM